PGIVDAERHRVRSGNVDVAELPIFVQISVFYDSGCCVSDYDVLVVDTGSRPVCVLPWKIENRIRAVDQFVSSGDAERPGIAHYHSRVVYALAVGGLVISAFEAGKSDPVV